MRPRILKCVCCGLSMAGLALCLAGGPRRSEGAGARKSGPARRPDGKAQRKQRDAWEKVREDQKKQMEKRNNELPPRRGTKDYAHWEMRKYATREAPILWVQESPSGLTLDYTGFDATGNCKIQSATLTQAERRQLEQGKPLPPDHSLCRDLLAKGSQPVVLYSPQGKKMGSLAEGPWSKGAEALEKAYPDITFVNDPLSVDTFVHARWAVSVSIEHPSQVLALIADKSFGVKDANVVQNLRRRLERGKTRVLRWPGRPDAPDIGWCDSVVVITGHADPHLADFVRNVGRTGLYRDKAVVFNSCGTELTQDLVSEINRKFGAIATFTHPDTITAAQVAGFMDSLVRNLSPTLHKESVKLNEAIRESQRKHRLRGRWVVSKLHVSHEGRHRIGALAEDVRLSAVPSQSQAVISALV